MSVRVWKGSFMVDTLETQKFGPYVSFESLEIYIYIYIYRPSSGQREDMGGLPLTTGDANLTV